MFTSASMFVLGLSSPVMLLLCYPVKPSLAVSCFLKVGFLSSLNSGDAV